VDILHLNLLLASVIGPDLYERVSYGQPFRMLGERLFARSAYGLPPLGKSPELCLEPVASVFGNHREYPLEEFEYKYSHPSDFDPDTFFAVEEICKSFIEEVSRIITSLHYKIIGCSTNWEQNNCCAALFNGIKRISPDTVTLIGGANCEGQMAEGIASLTDSIDYIFSGEGETAFADFLEKYSSGNPPSRRILVGKPVNRLDGIPLPGYESFIIQRKCFLEENAPAEWQIGYETSRGCWWGKCYFCGLNGMERGSFRQKDVKKVLADLEETHRHYPDRNIALLDKVIPVSYQKELLPALSEKKDFSPMGCELRPDLSLKDLVHLKNAKIYGIKTGIEALSTGLLKLMNKGVSAWQNILLLRNSASLGIYVGWNLLWGFPGDRASYYEETLNILPLIRHCCPPEVFRHICIDRFSKYFEEPYRFRIGSLRPWAVYNMVYPGWAEVNKLAYRFIGDYPCAAHDNPELIREIAREVTLWKEQWETSSLAMVPFSGFYMIYDKRDRNGKSKTHVVDYNRAQEIMTCRVYNVYNESGNIKWAVEQKLGLVVDSRYVPLVTAAPELLLTFEEDTMDNTLQ
jgi:ribosomal peptide maturation radical SAM protein 1